jgi:ribosomal protein S18 acetylase RimI-like enzyme
MKIERLQDKERLHGYLSRDRIRGSYMIGGLDPAFDEHTSWFGVSNGDDIQALIMVYGGLSAPAVFSLGSAQAMDELVQGCARELPQRFYAHLLEGHEASFSRHYRVDRLRRMIRMTLLREDFRPPATTDGVRRVTHADTASIMDLYRFYPDNFFEPYQLESGHYFCAAADDGRLVSVAGVHVVSEQYDIAAIGNVVTHPDVRGQGLSTRCTGKLLEELFSRVSLVALTVEEANKAARATFRKLGFAESHAYLEGFCELG